MISERSKISLTQFLDLFDISLVNLLIEKHFCFQPECTIPIYNSYNKIERLRACISEVTIDQIMSILGELVQTRWSLRTKISPRYSFDERWDDLSRCLYMDGYKIEDKKIILIEPVIEGKEIIEDDLTKELKDSDIPDVEGILRVLNNSAEDFKKNPPDYNGCLSNARVAFQTLATKIANSPKLIFLKQFKADKIGSVLQYLREASFISKKEEEGLSGVFSFVSPGAHTPVGLNEEELARLGRNMIVSMCYFLIKKYRSVS